MCAGSSRRVQVTKRLAFASTEVTRGQCTRTKGPLFSADDEVFKGAMARDYSRSRFPHIRARKYDRRAELTKEVLVGGQVIMSPIFNQIVIRDVVSKKMYLVIRDHLLVRT